MSDGLPSCAFASADASLRHTMLEALTCRYYKIRNLLTARSSIVDTHCYVTSEYDHEGRRIHIFACYAEYEGLSTVAQSMVPVIAMPTLPPVFR